MPKGVCLRVSAQGAVCPGGICLGYMPKGGLLKGVCLGVSAQGVSA